MTAVTDARRPLEKVLEATKGAVQQSDGSYFVVCPAHDDVSPSLHVTEAADGKLAMHCFKGCKVPSICHSMGMTVAELFPDRPERQSGGVSNRSNRKSRPDLKGKRIVATYDYHDADGALVYQAVRYEDDAGGKTFAQRRPNGQGGWIDNTKGIDRVLYKLPELIAADKSLAVYIVEGEKKADAIRKWDLVATCNVGGAGKWLASYNTYFRGRRVVILPDNDPVDVRTGACPGRDHARKVTSHLTGVATDVRTVNLPGLPLKGDIVDWIADGGTKEQFLSIINAPPEFEIDLSDFDLGGTHNTEPQFEPGSLLDPDEQTDVALASRFAKLYSQELNYVPEWCSFINWTGRRWVADLVQQEVVFAKKFSEHVWDESAKYEPDEFDDNQTNPLEALAKRVSTNRFVFDLARSARTQHELVTKASRLDAQLGLFNVLNGTIDLSTSEIRPHTREDYITKICQLDYNPDAKCPMWERFVYQVMGEDVELTQFLQTWLGYCLTGEVREHKVPIFWGVGGNGKSVLLNTVLKVMGPDYACVAPSGLLVDRGRDEHPTMLAGLFGKRLVSCSETGDGNRLNEVLIKQLSGGELIAARKMRQDFWEYLPSFKLVLLTNFKPSVRGTDPGLWRRLILVPFVQKFWDADAGQTGPEELKQDKKLESKLSDEFPGILNWLVQGAKNWYSNGLEVPLAAKAATAEYRGIEDVLQQFLDDQCDVNAAFRVRGADLYQSYKRWAEVGGEYVRSQTKFGIAISERFQKLTSNGVWYLGLSLKNDKTEENTF